MRYAFLIGGFVGFSLTALAGFMAQRGGGAVFRDAAIGCLVGAFLFRWFWSVVVKAFIEAVHQHRQKLAQAQQAANEESHPASGSTAKP